MTSVEKASGIHNSFINSPVTMKMIPAGPQVADEEFNRVLDLRRSDPGPLDANVPAPPHYFTRKRARCDEILSSGFSSAEEKEEARLMLYRLDQRETNALQLPIDFPVDQDYGALLFQGIQLLQQIHDQLQVMNGNMEDLQDQVQDVRFTVQDIRRELRQDFNASAINPLDRLKPVFNEDGELPDVWFPATIRELSNASPAQVQNLIDFYKIDVPVQRRVPALERRRRALAGHLGIRNFR